jgi:hypothetical protein
MGEDNEGDSYYDGEEWEYERSLVLSRWNGICEHCGEATDSPHVHHVYGLRYQIFEVLCPECHADHHGRDEIADYQSNDPSCKDCGKTCSWEKIDNKWRLIDSNGKINICKHLKEEAKNISESLNNTKKKVQKSLF